MTRAYPEEVTVDAGGSLVLRVSTTAERFRVRLHRAVPFAPVAEPSAWFEGTDAPPGPCDRRWDWPPYSFAIPAGCRSGAYVAVLEEDGGPPPAADPDARSGTALFVVRAPAARVLVNVPLFTYHAYNVADVDGTRGEGEGACLYSGPAAVTLHRPGGGTGGHPWDEVNADVYDRASPRQTFAHWDAKALAWLHAAGYEVDVCTDLELHARACDRSRYDALLAFGHQEYWTREMRAHLEQFAAEGGGVAFFGGNTCWFRVRYDAAQRTIARDGQWDDDPEERFTGASYRYGGGKWRGARPALGYTVHDGGHWAFAGTGVRTGATFGAQERLAGYECDGAAPGDRHVELLASANLRVWDVSDGSGEVPPGGRATLTVRPHGRGEVVNAGTADWARLLAGGHPVVSGVTRNVLDRWLARA